MLEQKQVDYFGGIDDIEQVLSSYSCDRVFLVLDEGAYINSGAKQKLEPFLRTKKVTVFSGFAPYFNLEQVSSGVRLLQGSDATILIVIGGGTAIDMAKLIKYFSAQDPDNISIGSTNNPTSDLPTTTIPIIAIPTTAGSGSEATHFAVLYQDQTKHSIADPTLLPEIAIIDAELLHSLPKTHRIAAGLDAFSQGIESYWAVGSTDASQAYAEEAIRLSWNHLAQFVNNQSPEHAAMMARASHLAGKAINLSKTTACHAISYAISLQHHIPHGIAVASTMGPMMRYNAAVTNTDLNDKRGLDHVQNTMSKLATFLSCDTIEAAARAVEHFFQSMTNIVSAADLGIVSQKQYVNIAAHVNTERLGNNPRRLSEQSIINILHTIGNERLRIN